MRSFKTWFVLVFLGFKSGLIQMFWTFKISFDVNVLAFLGCFGYFFKKWAF
jgi:hypothetical protein